MSGFGEYPRGTGDYPSRQEPTGFETAKVNRTQRSSTQGGGNGYQGNGNPAGNAAPQDDPWATPQNNSAAGARSDGPDPEPPF
ncbi:hypothetical protein [Pseudarthrobacter sp. SSS035]|uniref:hypothetical protein n=1 Tax=Pseudarthrobacter sp. SSS035 TaxID=2931399 RepID=UPI00200E8707|nr:hypothetical protein [Pseudarthrobacter sp. SSS035]